MIATVFDHIPLARESDRDQLQRAVDDALESAGHLGPASILLLLAAATGIMGALRHAINEAWDIHTRPPLVWRKLLDLALVVGGTLVLAAAVAARHDRRRAAVAADRARGAVPVPLAPRPAPEDARDLARRARRRAAARGRARALEFYFEDLSDFGALYGSLGALMALLVFVFAAANVLVFGAEFASEWSRLPPPEETREIVARGHAPHPPGAPALGWPGMHAPRERTERSHDRVASVRTAEPQQALALAGAIGNRAFDERRARRAHPGRAVDPITSGAACWTRALGARGALRRGPQRARRL